MTSEQSTTLTAYEPFPAGTRVAVRDADLVEDGHWRRRIRGNGLVTGFTYWNGDGGAPEANRTGGWYTVELTTGDYKGEQAKASSTNTALPAKRGERAPRAPRAKVVKPPRETLPRIVAFESTTDHGEYGAATCPHCGADGRYITWFLCADGTRRGAMAGCIKLFPVSALAAEHGRLVARRDDRAKKGGELASWDKAKLAAIDAFAAGGPDAPTEGAVLETIRSENARRQAWMDRRGRR